MSSPHEREDVSKFLVHLTRKTQNIDASDNLVNILKTKKIEARNFHCMFSRKIRTKGFTDLLKSKFKTVCFTETPLTQIRHLSGKIPGRKIHLKPFGLVFWKNSLIEKGANPAIYINAKGTDVRKLLHHQFDETFADVAKWVDLKKEREQHSLGIVQYFSLLNVISDKYNFLWEREWRYHSDYEFKFNEVVALIAEDPDNFKEKLQKKLSKAQWNSVKLLPIISPLWSYEEVIHQLSISIWNGHES